MAYRLTLTNHKGGTGKTTSVHNLAAALAERGLRVCMVDSDPQANLTQAAGAIDRAGPRLEDLLLAPGTEDPGTADALVRLSEQLALLPCSGRLATILDQYASHPAYDQGLDRVLAPIEAAFDLIVLDTPPGINQWSGLALLAADGVVIPARASDFDVTMAAQTWDFIEDHVRQSNPRIEVIGVLITQTHRTRLLLKEARRAFLQQEMHVFETWIPHQESVMSAPRYGMATVEREPDSRAGRAYTHLADELLITLRR